MQLGMMMMMMMDAWSITLASGQKGLSNVSPDKLSQVRTQEEEEDP